MFKDEIQTFILPSGHLNKNMTRMIHKFPSLYEKYINSCGVTPNEKLYCIYNDIDQAPICKSCNSLRRFNTFSLGYYNCTNIKCPDRDNISIRNKYKNSMLLKYGVISPLNKKEVRDKINATKQTIQYKQKISTIMSNPDLIKVKMEKVKKTNLAKYGSEYIVTTASFYEKRYKTRLKKMIHQTGSEFDIIEISKIGKPVSLLHKHCNTVFDIPRLSKNILFRCPTCNPITKSLTKGCLEIIEFIKDHYKGPIKINDRSVISPFELDILLPELKLAIEFNGLYWHSEKNSTKNMEWNHYNKTEQCSNLGIKLIHIFEDEWYHKQNVIKSRILNQLKVLPNKIYARHCNILEISSKEAEIFLNINHLDGFNVARYHYGLFLKNKLVSVLSIGKSRYDKSSEWEIIRYASKLDAVIVGGASKLFSHFIKTINPTSVMTYSDRNWGTGKFYEHLGFVFSHYTKPSYWYYHETSLTRLSRFNFQKKNFEKTFNIKWDPEKTETENAKVVNSYRIWDSGNSVYKLKRLLK